MHPLDKIESITGSKARSLHGALCDPARPSSSECPDEISAIVAEYYAITECGRLFHWRNRKVKELSTRRGRFQIFVNYTLWDVGAIELRDRVFPQGKNNGSDHEIDWQTYNPYLPIPGIEETEKNNRPDGANLLDRPPTAQEWERSWPIFYG